MKKIIVTLALFVSTISAFATEEKVSSKVLAAFQVEFNNATEVEWTVGSSYYMASFTYRDNHVFAYYSLDGDLMGMTRYISVDALSLALQSSLKKEYSEFWISDLFEVSRKGSTDYYITLENADKKIVLVASAGSDWELFKKIRKD